MGRVWVCYIKYLILVGNPNLLFEKAGSEKRAMPARAEKILYQNILLVSSEKSMTI